MLMLDNACAGVCYYALADDHDIDLELSNSIAMITGFMIPQLKAQQYNQ